ncbi:uncharacterized protein LOC111676006 isoform X2 [Lucilia cuprina]|uniref:uncharacterized protein LOC111676006 isoform X2 n=1 Tax=Lucilia cuprina TaxID=7375 RepID=UPI001F0614E4|nr:uncharacterized protein LOC111676006 isoform X2 [Lucilia cuprina]
MANTDIVPSWIKAKLFEKVLRETVKDFHEIKEFKVFPALAPGENYATVMLKVQADVLLTTGSVQQQTFMLKVAHDSELYRNEMSKWGMFVTESGMYRDIKPEFEKLYADAGLDVQFGAKGYELAVDKEYILLEDLSRRGFKNAKRQDCLDLEHCKAVLKKIAQFHAASAVRVQQKALIKYGIWGFVTVVTVMGAVLCDPTNTANIDNFVGASEEGDTFKKILYSNERYVRHLKVVLPWLCYRGALEK